MSPSEYAELVEFLGRQFTAIDQRFAAIDRRFDVVDRSIDELRGEMRGHFDETYRRLERWSRSITRSRKRYAGSRPASPASGADGRFWNGISRS